MTPRIMDVFARAKQANQKRVNKDSLIKLGYSENEAEEILNEFKLTNPAKCFVIAQCPKCECAVDWNAHRDPVGEVGCHDCDFKFIRANGLNQRVVVNLF